MKRWVSQRTPNTAFLNWALVLLRFWKYMRRMPRSPRHPQAEIQDLLFARMAQDTWHSFHRDCVDKVVAKEMAQRLAPSIRTAEIVAVLDVHDAWTIADVERALQPYFGLDLVAKPAHGCGGFVDLSRPRDSAALHRLHVRATADYFYSYRESQYLGLPRRILVERRLGDVERGPTEYKIFCTWGRPVGVQIDIGRFTGRHLRTFVLVDGFDWLPGDYEATPFTTAPAPPATWDEMLSLASQLSRPFDFVRIDLFDAPGGPYFSEFTFTPMAGADYAEYPRIRALLNAAWRAG